MVKMCNRSNWTYVILSHTIKTTILLLTIKSSVFCNHFLTLLCENSHLMVFHSNNTVSSLFFCYPLEIYVASYV